MILIGKGFGVTRDTLERQEVTIIAMTMGAVYLGFSAFMIRPTSLIILLVAMLGILFYLTTKYCRANIVGLQSRLESLTNSNITQMITPTATKISMLKMFMKLSYFFFIQQIFTISLLEFVIPLATSTPIEYWIAVDIFSQSCDTVALLWIMWIFRAKDRGQFFNISVVGSSAQAQPLPPYLQAKIPIGLNVPDNDGITMVIVCPQEFDRNHPYKRIMVAVPSRAIIQPFDEIR